MIGYVMNMINERFCSYNLNCRSHYVLQLLKFRQEVLSKPLPRSFICPIRSLLDTSTMFCVMVPSAVTLKSVLGKALPLSGILYEDSLLEQLPPKFCVSLP
jgi:hypothetical protein